MKRTKCKLCRTRQKCRWKVGGRGKEGVGKGSCVNRMLEKSGHFNMSSKSICSLLPFFSEPYGLINV